MPSKNGEFLPIRVFAQREMDEQRVEPGGSNEKPGWVLEGADLETRAEALRQGLVDGLNAGGHNPELPYIFEVELDGRDTAKSKRKAVVDMLSPSASKTPFVTGMKGSATLVLELPSDDAVKLIADRLESPERYDAPISCVTRIRTFRPIANFRGKGTYKLKLLYSSSSDEGIRRRFEEMLKDEDIHAERLRYSKKAMIYKAELSEESARAVVNGLYGELIFSIKPMPELSAVLDGLGGRWVPAVKSPGEFEGHPVLGILDSGIGDIEHLTPWIDASWSPYPAGDMDRSHGTFVAGVALYGDDFEGEPWVEGLPPKLVDACVLPAASRISCSEDELVDNIREAVAAKADRVKVWNLSVSMNSSIDDEEFSDFAQALDEIQDEYGVLFCKSAGNCMGFFTGDGKQRLSAGAESVRALTVGSVSHEKGEYDFSKVGDPSPFSRIGPGPQFIIKPEVSHYGGNAGVDPCGRLVLSGVSSFDLEGGGTAECGTSFSTPRVAALAANLAYSIDGDFDPLLIKAMIVHSASFPGDSLIPRDEKVREMGFGVPAGIPAILSDEPYEATLVLRDSLRKGEIIDILDFPMPDCLLESGLYQGQIVVTLVTSPILDPLQGGEYCQSDMEIKLGTYDNLVERDTTRPTILNPIGRGNQANLLLTAPYSKRSLKNIEGDFALRERMLIEYGGKYNPVKKYAIDLADLTEANRKKVAEGRHWYLRLKGTFRDAVERQSILDGVRPEQEFCLMTTIRDPKREAPVYNDVAAFLTAHGFVHQTVAVNNIMSARIK